MPVDVDGGCGRSGSDGDVTAECRVVGSRCGIASDVVGDDGIGGADGGLCDGELPRIAEPASAAAGSLAAMETVAESLSAMVTVAVSLPPDWY